MILKTASSVLALTVLLSSATYAADLYVPIDSEPVYYEPGFDWSRAYAGITFTGEFEVDGDDTYFGGGGQLGANYVVGDNYVLGVEGQALVITDGEDDTYYQLFVLGRAGVLITPEALLYGVVGVGYENEFDSSDDGDFAYQLGAGVELAVTEDISLRGQLTGYGYFGDDNAFDYAKATIGINFHF